LGCEAPLVGLLLYGREMRTYIYIDGFNFYYGAVKGTSFKWIDFKAFFTCVLKSHHHILSIKYFTALVSATPDDPNKSVRQKTYIRAIESYIPEMEVYYGHFLSHEISALLVKQSRGRRFADGSRLRKKARM